MARRQHHHVAAGRKRPGLLDERADKKQQLLKRDELTKRHEMHLLIHAGDGAVLPDEERGVVVRLRLVVHLIAAEQQLDARLAHQRANPLAAGLVVQERKRRGRLGPDDQLRPFGGRLARHRQIGVQDVVGLPLIPLLILRNISLNERDANLAALLDQHVVLEASTAPHRHPNEHCGRDANDDRSIRASAR